MSYLFSKGGLFTHDTEALQSLVSGSKPAERLLRGLSCRSMTFGFGDASGAGFGSSWTTDSGTIKYKSGTWGKDMDRSLSTSESSRIWLILWKIWEIMTNYKVPECSFLPIIQLQRARSTRDRPLPGNSIASYFDFAYLRWRGGVYTYTMLLE